MSELSYESMRKDWAQRRVMSEIQARQEALWLYHRERLVGWLCGLWTGLSRGSNTLSGLCTTERVGATGRSARVAAVPLAQICGSEGRCGDFDRAFRPLKSHSRDRWLTVASARLRDIPLPRVMLVRIGDRYFVRDGHHRISVARALGEAYIDAEVV
jgi:hypothetical protein